MTLLDSKLLSVNWLLLNLSDLLEIIKEKMIVWILLTGTPFFYSTGSRSYASRGRLNRGRSQNQSNNYTNSNHNRYCILLCKTLIGCELIMFFLHIKHVRLKINHLKYSNNLMSCSKTSSHIWSANTIPRLLELFWLIKHVILITGRFLFLKLPLQIPR